MVKKTIAFMAMVVMLLSYTVSLITTRPLELPMDIMPIESNENDVNHEVLDLAHAAKKSHANVKPLEQVTISPYDPIFKSVCSEHGNDWRLMSAMAYHESRFRPDVTSTQGAQGMMQIMPNVAKFFNVEKEDLTDVETNITVANLLVNRISHMLKFSKDISQRDRMGLILASYNGGIGYVLNARRLARENGQDADSWSVISGYLQQMKSAEFAEANNVRRFRGVSQTIAYVDNVLGHYNHYCEIAML